MNLNMRISPDVRKMREQGLEFIAWMSSEAYASTRIGANNRITDTGEVHQQGTIASVSDNGRPASVSEVMSRDPSKALRTAARIAATIPELPWYRGFPAVERKELGRGGKPMTPEQRGRVLRICRDLCAQEDMTANGFVASIGYRGAIISSTGEQYWNRTLSYQGVQSVLSLVVSDAENVRETVVGRVANGVRGLRTRELVTSAIKDIQLQRSLPLEDISPGAYPAVIGGRAFAETLELLKYALSGQMAHQGLSFLTKTQPGEKVFSDLFTLQDRLDEPGNPGAAPCIGASVKASLRTSYIDKGKFVRHWYAGTDALQYKKEETGIPANMSVRAGTGPSTIEDAAEALGNGVIINAFDYTRPEDWSTGSFVCVGRFGAYRVRDGKLVARLPNLRILDTVPQIFGGIQWLSRRRLPMQDNEHCYFTPFSTFMVPAFTRIGSIRITGSTPMDQQR